MLKLNTEQQRQPFGGHHFPEYGITFKGETFKEVVKKLSDFRIGNNIPIGDPEQEVLRYYAENWPWMVRRAHHASEPEALDPTYVEWRKWVYAAWKTPPKKLITKKEAEDRWKICETCPHNRKMEWKETKESAELTRRVFLLRRGMEVPEYLGYCSLHRADLSALSLIDAAKAFSGKKDPENQPGCWII